MFFLYAIKKKKGSEVALLKEIEQVMLNHRLTEMAKTTVTLKMDNPGAKV